MKKITFFTILLIGIYSGYSQNATLGLFTERTVNDSFANTGLNIGNADKNEAFSDVGTDSGLAVIEIKANNGDNNTQAFFNYGSGARLDMSAYTSYHISLKSSSTNKTILRIEDQNNVQVNLNPATYGFVNDGNWHSLTIPIADITTADPSIDLSLIKNLFIVKTASPRIAFDAPNYIFYIDDIYLSGPPTLGLFTERTVTSSFSNTGLNIGNADKNETYSDVGTDNGLAVIEIKANNGDMNTQAFFNYGSGARLDMSAYTFYHISLKSSSTNTTILRIEDQGSIQVNLDPVTYGFVNDGNWHSLKIPITDITAADPSIDLSLIKNLFIVKTASPRVAFDAPNYIFYIDDIYLSGLVVNEWTGGTNTDWNTALNWNQSLVPTASHNVSIPEVTNAPIIGATTGAVSYNLSITESEGVNITAGGSLIVSGTSTGNVTYNRTLDFVTGNDNGWHLIASPVAGQTYNNAYANTNNLATSGTKRGLAFYNDALGSNLKYTYLLSDDTNAASFNAGNYSGSGVGYSAKTGSTGNIAFTGTINTADVNGVSVSTTGNGFNLLGVPYTSYISSQAFLTANANLDQTQIWVWKQDNTSGGNFITMTAKGDNFILAPGQGFFVKATSGTTVNFAESNQTANADTFKKSSRTEVKLLMNDGEKNRFAKFYYVDNATKGFDVGWEGEVFGGLKNSLDVFSQLVEDNLGKNYQVQSLPKSEMESILIPLGLRAASGKEITFSVTSLNLPSGVNVYLEDRELNLFTNLNEGNYTITLDTELNGIGRFFLRTTSSVLSVDHNQFSGVSIFKKDNSTLSIYGLQQGKVSISLFNILGKQVMSSNLDVLNNMDVQLPKLSTGVYILKLDLENGSLNKKIILE